MLSLLSWKSALGAIGGIALAVGLVWPLEHGSILSEPATWAVTLVGLGVVGFRLRSRAAARRG